MTVAFVLQGGASLAAAQVGMLRALLEAGIRPDIVVGTSASALNAVAFAQDPTATGLDELAQLWGRVRRRDVLPVSPATELARLLGRSDGLTSPAPLRSWLERGVAIRDLADAVIPVGAVATDAGSGAAVVLSTGCATDALFASAAVPGVFPAGRCTAHALVDGGVAADLPIMQAEELGATTSYVLPRAVMAHPRAHPQGAAQAMVRAAQRGRGPPEDVVETLVASSHSETDEPAGARRRTPPRGGSGPAPGLHGRAGRQLPFHRSQR